MGKHEKRFSLKQLGNSEKDKLNNSLLNQDLDTEGRTSKWSTNLYFLKVLLTFCDLMGNIIYIP